MMRVFVKKSDLDKVLEQISDEKFLKELKKRLKTGKIDKEQILDLLGK